MEPTRWLELHAPGFEHLAREEREAIKDFSLLWSLFEALVLNTRADMPTIVAACEQLRNAGKLKISDFARPIAYFSDRYFSAGSLTPHYAGLHLPAGVYKALVEKVVCGHSTDEAEALSAMLIIVYRLRNNLIHGTKWSYGIKDQLANFVNANEVLMTAMGSWM